MQRLKAFWIVGIAALTACSSYEPRPNQWPDQRIDPPKVAPVELPPWPAIGDDFHLTPQQAKQLLDFADAADANTEIARELAIAVEQLSASHNALVDAGSAEHELAELRGRLLHEERQGNWVCKIPSLGLLGIGAWLGAQ